MTTEKGFDPASNIEHNGRGGFLEDCMEGLWLMTITVSKQSQAIVALGLCTWRCSEIKSGH